MVEEKIKEGYKKTEIGIVPEDWDIKSLGQIGVFSKGKGIKKDESRSGTIPCVRYGEIYTFHNDYIKSYNSFISREIANTSKQLTNGDILFAGSGETKEEIGKCVAFIDDIEAYVGGDVIILSPKIGESLFWGYLLNSPFIVKQKSSRGQGDAIVHIHASSLSDILVPIPQQTEQNYIAKSLVDIDKLLQSLEKLIQKKKKIKQGTMQQLLTGKKRLPGFNSEWGVIKLGNISDIRTGKKNTEDKSDEGIYPFFIRSQTVERINSYSFDGEAILIPGEGGIGSIYHYIDGKFDYHQRVYKISNFDVVLGKYVYYYMKQNFSNHAMQNTVKATVDSLRLSTFEGFEIHYPVSIEEQKLIASILTEMELEIEALEQKLEKYKKIKQGMMQELLTGRIRLI